MQERIDAVQRMQDYIQRNCGESISLADLAKAAGFSPFYSARIFRELTGYSPGSYLRRVRLSRSALRLRDTDCRILDLALEMGYESVDGYQRAFRREFGCNPGDYARSPVPLPLFTVYGVKFRHPQREEKEMQNIVSVFVQLVHKPARRLIVKRGIRAEEYFGYCEEVGCDVWGLLTSMRSLCGEPVCLWLPESYRKPGTSTYVQGVETDPAHSEPVPDGFDAIDLPAAEYLLFQGEPFCEEHYEEAIRNVQLSMDRYDPTVLGYAWDDSNPRIQLEPRGERGYIELRAVKPLCSAKSR